VHEFRPVRAGRCIDDDMLRIARHLAIPVAARAVDRQYGGVQVRALFGPVARGTLSVGIDQHRAFAVVGEMRREVGGQRGLAHAALRTGHEHRLHPDPLD
jgi:hypothetical protein